MIFFSILVGVGLNFWLLNFNMSPNKEQRNCWLHIYECLYTCLLFLCLLYGRWNHPRVSVQRGHVCTGRKSKLDANIPLVSFIVHGCRTGPIWMKTTVEYLTVDITNRPRELRLASLWYRQKMCSLISTLRLRKMASKTYKAKISTFSNPIFTHKETTSTPHLKMKKLACCLNSL